MDECEKRARLSDIRELLTDAMNKADRISENLLAAHIEHAVACASESLNRIDQATVPSPAERR